MHRRAFDAYSARQSRFARQILQLTIGPEPGKARSARYESSGGFMRSKNAGFRRIFSMRARNRSHLYVALLLAVGSVVTFGGTGTATAALSVSPGAAQTSLSAQPSKFAQGPIIGRKVSSFTPAPGARTKANPPTARSTSSTTAIGSTTYTDGPWRIESNYWFTVEMYCPSGTLAVSGGESNESAGGINLHDSRPLANGSGWFVLVSNTYPDASQFRTYVVCVSGVESTNIATHYDPPIAPNAHRYIDSDCGSFRKVLGGGGGWHDGSWNEIRESDGVNNPSGNGWTVLTRNRDADYRTASAVVICAERILGAQKWETFPGTLARFGPGQMMFSNAACPAGTQMVSGGAWSYSDGPFAELEVSRLTDSYPNGNGWTAYAHTRNQTYGGGLRAYVTCAS